MHKTTQRCTLALGALVAMAGLFGASAPALAVPLCTADATTPSIVATPIPSAASSR